jgi:membrane-associated phospholipid phosphatase
MSVEIAFTLGLLIIATLLFAYLVKRVFILQNYQLDHKAFEFFQQYVSDVNNNIMMLITYFGTHYFLIPANLILIVYFLFIRPHKWYSIKIPSIAISSLLLMFVLKLFFSRPRPLPPLLEEAKGMSFPSGHALMSVTFYGLIAYMIWFTPASKLSKGIMYFILFALVVMIGISRIYLRVHYTSDVIAGFCMGFLWLVISILVARKVEAYGKKEVDPIVDKTPSTS